MKLVTFIEPIDSAPRLGVLREDLDLILDAQKSFALSKGEAYTAFSSMQALIEGGKRSLDALREISDRPDGVFIPIKQVQLLAPLPRPEQIRDSLGFRQHMVQAIEARVQAAGLTEMSATQALRLTLFDKRPHWYKCNRFAVCGPDTVVTWPPYSRHMDYELEMAMVIGKRCRDIDAANFRDYVFGYTIFNDLSARDVQNDEMGMLGPNKSKDFDNSNVFGPCIVTADAFDPADVAMTTRINGEVQNVNRSSTIHWGLGTILAAISRFETIYPGEIIGSGTVGGGSGLETGRFLSPGDVIELEIEGIGLLRNKILGGENRESL